MSFTRKNMGSDLTDIGALFEWAADLEFRLATDGLELEQSGLCFQRVPPNVRFPFGHTHNAGADGLELLVCGAPSLGDGRREDVEGERDWWTG